MILILGLKLLLALPVFASNECDKKLTLEQIQELSTRVDRERLIQWGKKALSKKAKNPEAFQKEFYDLIFSLESNNQLEASLGDLIKMVRQSEYGEKIKNYPDTMLIAQLSMVLKAELLARGYHQGYRFPTWPEKMAKIDEILKTLPPTKDFLDEEFKTTFKKITNQVFYNYNEFTFLGEPYHSLTKRVELIRRAKEIFTIMVWGWHDDTIGKLMADEVIAAHKRGKAKGYIMVDYLTSLKPGYNQELKRMAEAGVPVIYFKGKENPFFGLHIKEYNVDYWQTLGGGRNIGEHYLSPAQWMDSDYLITGGGLTGIENPNFFAQHWNEQVEQQGLSFNKLKLIEPISEGDLDGLVATVAQIPSALSYDPIHLLVLYGLKNAKTKFDVMNAYYILDPIMKRETEAALKRGVPVRIFTNSAESIDEPIITYLIMKSVREMYRAGAQIYLKKGKTLHTKQWGIDNMAISGTYNNHPRSTFYEAEKVHVFLGPVAVEQINENFENGITDAVLVTSEEQIPLPESPEMDLLFSLFSNQL
ncbi:MAG: phosphatidylserine/phosphatidylglycerophosphate/cardiolipin synthase family protein [Bacteriovoracaceae bacterium]|nr:phosphatidylserine/phosphatidylglycerophosphate/cardiolipin synthase family protein [Bacteriovoracaceae bacterium]